MPTSTTQRLTNSQRRAQNDPAKRRSAGRYLVAKALAKLNGQLLTSAAQERYPHDQDLQRIVRAPVAGNVGADPGPLTSLDVAARLLTVFGKLNPRPAELPFNVELTGLDTDPVAYSVRSGKAVPATAASFSSFKLERISRKALLALSAELLARPDAESRVVDAAIRAVAREVNRAAFDPSEVGSLTNGAPEIVSGGSGVNDIDFDFHELIGLVSNGSSETLAWVGSPRDVRGLAGLRLNVGPYAYPGISVQRGGELLGIPLVVGDGVPDGIFVLIDAAEILTARGEIAVDVSQAASIELDTVPTGSLETPTGQSANVVSLFQLDAVGLLIGQEYDWTMRRPNTVAYISGFNPGAGITT